MKKKLANLLRRYPRASRSRDVLRKFLSTIFTASKVKDCVGVAGNRSISDEGSYITAVKEAIGNCRAFYKFKCEPRYIQILEHVSQDQGAMYLEIIRTESPIFMDKFNEFKENDIIGGTKTFCYPGIGDISPSTLRYIKVASDLRIFFGERLGDRIAEIGVGYGGQLLIMDKVCSCTQYDLFDLPPVLELASKYLESHTLNTAYHLFTLNQHRGDVEYDLVISNYAFSELPSRLQLMYIKKIISKAKRGYLTMNSGKGNSAFQEDKLSLADLKQVLPAFEVLPENPLTHAGNYVIVWGCGHQKHPRSV